MKWLIAGLITCVLVMSLLTLSLGAYIVVDAGRDTVNELKDGHADDTLIGGLGRVILNRIYTRMGRDRKSESPESPEPQPALVEQHRNAQHYGYTMKPHEFLQNENEPIDFKEGW
ncbi:hypothetical protein [Blastopirellula retiformator]|uniref:Uncharacterized protein n=1 Tax=Blastopirellula retiformator TaxID=2527970 RepID=A0A5C5UWF6_9BACT|nr:hypothetical protein [Blastopirellula retiformator]TWT30696.1 hypothetical protein Enr8_42190 [Blastopirellula retiformator]